MIFSISFERINSLNCVEGARMVSKLEIFWEKSELLCNQNSNFDFSKSQKSNCHKDLLQDCSGFFQKPATLQ